MELDLEEQERIDELKAFWSRWGRWITIGLTLVLFAFAGWRGWQWWQARQATAAAEIAEQVEDALRRGQLSEAAPLAASLMNNYSASVPAPLAALRIARAQVDAGDGKAARKTLSWVLEHSKDPGIQAVARIRLAGLLLDEAVAEPALLAEGLKLLEGEPPAELAGLWLDRRGDLLVESGQTEAARKAWSAALERLDAQSPLRSLVQLKFETLGGG